MRDDFPSTGNIVGCFLLITIIVMEVKISLQQHCPPKITSQYGYALTATQYKTSTTQNYPTCVKECDQEERCMSLNFHVLTKTCELNRQTKESLPDYYEERPHSIYMINTASRTPEPVMGLAQNSPGKSCLEILSKGSSIGSGVYWIDPANTGTPMQAYCDMTTDGGGWTVVKKSILQTSTNPVLTKVKLQDINVIAMHDKHSLWVIPRVEAMMDIKTKMGFQQIHFYCHKKSVGRVMSIMTKNNTAGQAVVNYFTGPEDASSFPAACGSFDRLPDDTSFLSQNCDKWGTTSGWVNKWGDNSYSGHTGPSRLGSIPFSLNLPPKYYYGFSTENDKTRLLCDDSYVTPEPHNVGDILQISVR